jgi:Domain of unknown function (DUF4260)
MKDAEPPISLFRPDVLLRLEGLFWLAVSCIAYQHFYSGRWGFFALLFLAPDLALLPYLLSQGRFAAALYNSAHNYVLPLALGLGAWWRGWPVAGQLALIWIAHIGLDRAIGFGLKFSSGFKPTHIQACASPAK